jgi:hypothetical protein
MGHFDTQDTNLGGTMTLRPMAPGGQWLRPPHDGPHAYIGPKQLDAHFKRLVGDGWMPCDDPRREEDQPQVIEPVQDAKEVALQARIDQLEAMVRQLLTKSSEQADDSTTNAISTDSQSSPTDSRSKQRKPTV